MNFGLFYRLVLILVISISYGCGDTSEINLGKVTGTITVNGQPLSDGEITFQPGSGRPSLGMTNSLGFYELHYTKGKKGALVGSHSVIITTSMPDDGRTQSPGLLTIPSRYNTATELSFEVKPGQNKADFQLDIN